MSDERRERGMRLRRRRVVLLVPGSVVGGRPESPEQQLEAWEATIAFARAILAAGGNIVVEGDPYAGVIVGLIAGEYLEPTPAEGERPETTASRAESRTEARVVVWYSPTQDDVIDESLRALAGSGVMRLEPDREGFTEEYLQADAVVAIGRSAADSSRAGQRRKTKDIEPIFLSVPIGAGERGEPGELTTAEGREILGEAERVVRETGSSWRERRSDRRTQDQEKLFAEERWLERIPHELYAQLLVERLERR